MLLISDGQSHALAAALRLPSLSPDEAAVLAEREGLATHLTSLVLVDRSGEVVEDLPVLRKVALPTSRAQRATERMLMRALADTESIAPADLRLAEARTLRRLHHPVRSRQLRYFLDRADDAPQSAPDTRDEAQILAEGIDWRGLADRLSVADLAGLAADVEKALLRYASRDDIIAAAERLGLDPLLVAIGWLATLAQGTDRSAGRVARRIFRGIDQASLDQEMRQLGGDLRTPSR